MGTKDDIIVSTSDYLNSFENRGPDMQAHVLWWSAKHRWSDIWPTFPQWPFVSNVCRRLLNAYRKEHYWEILIRDSRYCTDLQIDKRMLGDYISSNRCASVDPECSGQKWDSAVLTHYLYTCVYREFIRIHIAVSHVNRIFE